MNRRGRLLVALAVLITGCAAPATPPSDTAAPTTPPSPATAASPPSAAALRTGADGRPFVVTSRGSFDEPWAMTFLPDGRALVTERGGSLLLVEVGTGARTPVAGTPKPVVAGQGGLGDVVLSPSFAADKAVYLSWVEPGEADTTGAVIGRGTLTLEPSPRIEGLTVIWRQSPKTTGSGHYSHRLAFSPDGRYLFVTSGERQKFDPAQDLEVNLGKVLRLNPDGSPAADNPFAGRGSTSAEIWSYGHRNGLGLAFDPAGNLWESEMGPRGGDELNLIVPGKNYGWPLASNGSHYSGQDIPDHRAGDGFEAPAVWWNPSISPGSLMIYTGSAFAPWTGDAFIGALSGQALIRVDLSETTARKADQWPMNARIREVEQGPDGSIWLLEDGTRGRLLQLTPVP